MAASTLAFSASYFFDSRARSSFAALASLSCCSTASMILRISSSIRPTSSLAFAISLRMAANSRFVFTSDACWFSFSTLASATLVSLSRSFAWARRSFVRSSIAASRASTAVTARR